MTLVHKILKLFLISLTIFSINIVLADQPRWISDSATEYPNEMYLVGRGIGSTEEEASNRARGDLATIFEVRIEVMNENSTTVAQSGKNEQINKLSTQQVSAKTDKVIKGINIAQIWRNPETTDFHVLAVLPRAQAANSLREELSKIDEEVQAQIQAAESSNDTLLKLGTLVQALKASIKRDGFQASLKIVDPTGVGVKALISQATIQAKIEDTLKRIQISPEVSTNDGVKEFFSLLKGGLAAAGVLASSPTDAEFALVGTLKMTDLGRKENWNWMRATVEVTLQEKISGRVRGSKTWPVKASAQDAKTARTRALIEIEKLLKQELRLAIIEFSAS